ncbi:hypothetical protein MW871_10000 [Flavobacterium sp. I-SCBP12n]|uniref:Uncharacterized protein n=1 Tax=Flavobacterium pygoscelis TaxID=2893176 RepID=A0A9X1XT97_9FLAO|nr:hypothetical protein [Flavobacterium pygoscelis]MCK8142221.1 hypothetical protein [Flavobacterium pygoscelis]
MKKLLFTALAVVAFSGVAMAETSVQKQVFKNSCGDVAANTVNVAEEEYHNETGQCFDSWVYNYIYNNALENCLN